MGGCLEWQDASGRIPLRKEVTFELRPGREGSTSHANSGPRPEGTADAQACGGNNLGCISVVWVCLLFLRVRKACLAGEQHEVTMEKVLLIFQGFASPSEGFG